MAKCWEMAAHKLMEMAHKDSEVVAKRMIALSVYFFLQTMLVVANAFMVGLIFRTATSGWMFFPMLLCWIASTLMMFCSDETYHDLVVSHYEYRLFRSLNRYAHEIVNVGRISSRTMGTVRSLLSTLEERI